MVRRNFVMKGREPSRSAYIRDLGTLWTYDIKASR
jgi:hypothetical protein